MTYNKSDDAIQAIYRPLTQNTNETALIFTHTCPFTPHAQCPTYLRRSKVTYEHEIYAQNQKILKSLTEK